MVTGIAQWRTSSYSGTNGGQCVEVGWRTSSHSGPNGGQRVEVGQSAAIAVRDSRDRAGLALTFTATAWQDFLSALK